MSMMVSFVLSFFPRDVLDEILNLIESVSEDFPSYSYIDLRVVKITMKCALTFTHGGKMLIAADILSHTTGKK